MNDFSLVNDWPTIKRFFEKRTWWYVIASTNPDGSPHVAGVGSLLLEEGARGFYFEIFMSQTSKNLDHNPRVCVMALRLGVLFWVKAFLCGGFSAPIGFRLTGLASPRKLATEDQRRKWHRRVWPATFSRGGKYLAENLKFVREIHFQTVRPILLGRMTRDQV